MTARLSPTSLKSGASRRMRLQGRWARTPCRGRDAVSAEAQQLRRWLVPTG